MSLFFQGIWRFRMITGKYGELLPIVKRPIAKGAIFLSETTKAFAK